MFKLINQHTYKDFPDHRKYEMNGKPSKTVPGQSVPLRQLVERYVRGQEVPVFEPSYDEHGHLPDNLETMSRFDKIDLARQIRESIQEHQNRPKPEPKPTKPEPAPVPVPDSPPVPSPDLK